MAKIITYKNEGPKGIFCQLKLDNGEKIIIGIASTGILISKLFLGIIPIRKLFEVSLAEMSMIVFKNISLPIENPSKAPLDFFKTQLLECSSVKEVIKVLNKLRKSIKEKN